MVLVASIRGVGPVFKVQNRQNFAKMLKMSDMLKMSRKMSVDRSDVELHVSRPFIAWP